MSSKTPIDVFREKVGFSAFVSRDTVEWVFAASAVSDDWPSLYSELMKNESSIPTRLSKAANAHHGSRDLNGATWDAVLSVLDSRTDSKLSIADFEKSSKDAKEFSAILQKAVANPASLDYLRMSKAYLLAHQKDWRELLETVFTDGKVSYSVKKFYEAQDVAKPVDDGTFRFIFGRLLESRTP